MRVAIIAPAQTTLYARLVTWLVLREPGVELAGVVVRSLWSRSRVREELRLFGWERTVEKAVGKLFFGSLAPPTSMSESNADYARSVGLPGRSIAEACAASPRGKSVEIVTTDSPNTPAAAELLRRIQPHVIVFVGGGLIREPVLTLAPHGVLNAHAGLLPEYRGMDVARWPLLAWRGEPAPALGVTLTRMDPGIDTGPILIRRPIELGPGDTHVSVMTRIERAAIDLMLDGVRGLRDGTLAPEPRSRAAGKQYFVMHPRLAELADRQLRRAR